MNLKTMNDGNVWLKSHGINVSFDLPSSFGLFTASYLLPKDSGRKTALARLLVNHMFAEERMICILVERGIWQSSENEFLFGRGLIPRSLLRREFPCYCEA